MCFSYPRKLYHVEIDKSFLGFSSMLSIFWKGYIHQTYQAEIKRTMQDDKFDKLQKLKARLSDLKG